MARAPKKQKPSKRTLEKDCLELWSLCVRARDGVCRMCGSDKSLTAHHIRSVSNAATRYDIDNGMALCWKCHSLQKFQPERFWDKVIDLISLDRYLQLKDKSLRIWKPGVYEMQMMKGVLERELKAIRSDWRGK